MLRFGCFRGTISGIGLTNTQRVFLIQHIAVEHSLAPQALREMTRLGTLDAGRLKSSDIFPLEALYFGLGTV